MTKSNKTALITGASAGIGRELAVIHAQNGGDLILVARRKDRLDALKQELESSYGVQVTVIPLDLTLPNAAEVVHDAVTKQQLQVDYLINNAGFGGIGNFHERDWHDEANMIQLNIVTLCQLTHLFLPDMIARKSGKIMNLSSTASLVPGPYQAVYYATKAFVTSFSYAISCELEKTGVTVTAILPGATASEFGQVSGLDKTPLFDHTVTPKHVATQAYKAMMKGKLKQITGAPLHLRLLLKLTPFLPERLVMSQVKRLQMEK